MAKELIRETVTCKASGTFEITDVTGEAVAVQLANSNNADATPTVAKAQGATQVYGKVVNVVKGGDAFNISSVDRSTGNVTYGDLVTVATDGILSFTKRNAAGDTVEAGAAADIGRGIQPTTGNAGGVQVPATGGVGEVVAYSGNTVYVDLRA